MLGLNVALYFNLCRVMIMIIVVWVSNTIHGCEAQRGVFNLLTSEMSHVLEISVNVVSLRWPPASESTNEKGLEV